MVACGAARGFESRFTSKPSTVTGVSCTVHRYYRVLVWCFGEGGYGDCVVRVSFAVVRGLAGMGRALLVRVLQSDTGQPMITRGGDGNVDERDSTSCSNSRPSLPTMQVASRSCG